jgi:halocyanin-like protein
MDEAPRRRAVLTAAASGIAAATAGCLGGDGGTTEQWLSNANNYDGMVARTGQETVTVAVGAVDGLSFDPAAVRITTGTEVLWEWTSFGGGHNVAEENGVFESEIQSGEGETFSHTFTDSGQYRYVCTPHQTQGMLGVVEVVDE